VKNNLLPGIILLTVLQGCQDPNADLNSYLTTTRPTVLFSVNDGESLALLSNDGETVNVEDSVTVIRLFSDRPPEIKTVYGTTSSSIVGSPHAAIMGRFGIVTNHDIRLGGPVPPEITGRNQIVTVDLESSDLSIASRVELESQPWLAVAHPDGRRVIVALTEHWRVFELQADGSLTELARSRSPGTVYSFDIGSDGRTIIAAMAKGSDVLSAERGIFRFAINEDSRVSMVGEITSERFTIEGPFSPRISPDGKRALVLNSLGLSDGVLDDVLVIDLSDDSISDRIPQIADGLESLAFHPSGEFAVISCLDFAGPTTTSHLAVVDLESGAARVLYHLPVERVPEGIEFTPDGTRLFVGSTFANHLAVFDVEGTQLVRSRYVLPTGYGHAALAIATQ
jgi:DNA-binding beta-propeller fold protein YncE